MELFTILPFDLRPFENETGIIRPGSFIQNGLLARIKKETTIAILKRGV